MGTLCQDLNAFLRACRAKIDIYRRGEFKTNVAEKNMTPFYALILYTFREILKFGDN